jgi:hypothetical protein
MGAMMLKKEDLVEFGFVGHCGIWKGDENVFRVVISHGFRNNVENWSKISKVIMDGLPEFPNVHRMEKSEGFYDMMLYKDGYKVPEEWR